MSEFLDLSVLEPFGLDLDQYFGLWAMDEQRFFQGWQQLSRMDLAQHVRTQQAVAAESLPARGSAARAGRIALVSLEGVMTKRGSSLSGTLGTIAVRQQLRAAARDESVDAILLRIDSPGGTVAGTAELGGDVAKIAAQKPVFAFIEDLGASAAFWVASQATKVFANDRTALVGSIGTLIAFHDLSAAAAMAGVKPIVIKVGEMKGTGFEGTEITDAQKEFLQEIVDATQEEFTAAIARGRGMSTAAVQKSVTGRVFKATDAMARGLIDAIAGFDEVVAELDALVKSSSNSGRRISAMSEPNSKTDTPTIDAQPATSAALTNGDTAILRPAGSTPPKPAAASFEEIIIGCDLDLEDAQDCLFACACQSQSLSLPQAQQALLKCQRELLAEARQQKPAAAPDGVDTIGTAASSSDGAQDAASAWRDAVSEERKSGCTPQQAVIRANRKHPGLREQLLDAQGA